jgi:hypothetical protein
MQIKNKKMGREGFEPPTSRSSAVRSPSLSYRSSPTKDSLAESPVELRLHPLKKGRFKLLSFRKNQHLRSLPSAIQMKRQEILNYNDVLETYKSKESGIKALAHYTNWFPLRASPQLSGIVADLMGDGHLQGKNKGRLDYTSKSVEELNRFNREIFALFGVQGKIRECKTNTYGTMNLGVNNKPLTRVLKLIGVPAGNKTLQGFDIPAWILSDKENFARFVNRLLCCEGCVSVQDKSIELSMYKSLERIPEGINFFTSIKKHLELYFEIRTTNPFLGREEPMRKHGFKTRGIRLKIKNRPSLINFQKHIGLEDKNKEEKLNKILS